MKEGREGEKNGQSEERVEWGKGGRVGRKEREV